MSWSEIARTGVSWLFYAGAVVGLALSLGLIASTRKEAFRFFAGHLRIGLGFAILCLGGGIAASGFGRDALLSVVGAGCGVVGYIILFYGRRRSREVNQFLQAVDEAKAKIESRGKKQTGPGE